MRWFGHLIRKPLGHFLLEVFQACPTGSRPKTGREHLRIPKKELENMFVERNVYGNNGKMSRLLMLVIWLSSGKSMVR